MSIKKLIWNTFSYLPTLNKKKWLLTLCYHSIGSTEPYISVDLESFKNQITYLNSRKDIDFISFQDFIDITNGKKPLTKNAVLLTFDDAYSDFLLVSDYLESLSIPSVLAVIGNSILRNKVMGISKVKNCLTKEAIKNLLMRENIVVLPHGMTHRNLSILTRKEIAREIDLSVNLIADLTGNFPKAFVYPFGGYNLDVISETRKHKIEISFTIDGGRLTKDNMNHLVPRYCINSFTEQSFFNLISSDGLSYYLRAKALFHTKNPK